jgi:4-hydroxy-2-oxoheptanedioate aldolase
VIIRPSRVIQNLKRNVPTLGIALHYAEPANFEMVSLMGFQAIWLDLEHHSTSVENAAHLMRAARVGGTDIIARPGKGEFMRMGRLLEAGASGIMYPRCDSAAEAAEVVKWAKFAPIGKRGFDGSGPDVPYLLTPMKEYVAEANQNTYVIIQIEEPHALDQVEEIMAVPGVDMVMLGPADFSVLTGIPGEFGHPTIRNGIERIAKAAKDAGKNWAATCGSLEVAKDYIQKGCRLTFHGCDLVYVHQGFQQLKAAAEETLNLSFDSQLIGQKSYLEEV